MGPKGPEPRNFFLKRLEATMADASKSDDRVLIMIFSHGDYDSAGGLCIGIDVTSTFEDNRLLKPSHVTSIFLKYPNVKTTIYMNSYYSEFGHAP
ncbi:hypothetical protein SI65_01489 [Aspergillus cristatus]|uniref:Caspase family p20 domain-containing protein n=1 Tax=Aspergillus cristatus TaxID=573508 RepID=A0A1E3BSG7_ASPCR|nr:hypothetical protein SI65_01489 [Aspergillus cristatus]